MYIFIAIYYSHILVICYKHSHIIYISMSHFLFKKQKKNSLPWTHPPGLCPGWSWRPHSREEKRWENMVGSLPCWENVGKVIDLWYIIP